MRLGSAATLPFAAGDIPGFAVTHHTRIHWSVRVWGNLGPFWADAFALGLSGLKIGIQRGFARQDSAGRWIADFVLTPGPGAPAPSSLDFLALAFGAPSTDDGEPMVLSQYALDGSPDMGAALYLEVRGPDRLGFLGGLLRPLARLGLSPWEMLITTSGGEAFDRLFLKMVSGAVPSEDVRRVLEGQLEAAVAVDTRPGGAHTPRHAADVVPSHQQQERAAFVRGPHGDAD